MGDPEEHGPFDNVAGADILRDVTSILEAELVSFVHRVKFFHGMHYDRARAAAVLLTTLASNGLAWSPPEDATPALVEHAFQTYFQTVTRFPDELRRAIEEDIARFAKTFANREVMPRLAGTHRVSDALRVIGTTPDAWHWAAPFAFDFVDAWMHSESPARRTAEMALAIGVSAKRVTQAIAQALLREANAVKRSRLDVRDALLKMLARVATSGIISGSTRTLADQVIQASRDTGAAFLQQFRQHLAASSDPATFESPPDDPLQALVHTAAELIRMCDSATQRGALDPYQAGALVEKLVRESKTDALGMIRSTLQTPVLRMAKRRANELRRGLVVVGHNKRVVITVAKPRRKRTRSRA